MSFHHDISKVQKNFPLGKNGHQPEKGQLDLSLCPLARTGSLDERGQGPPDSVAFKRSVWPIKP